MLTFGRFIEPSRKAQLLLPLLIAKALVLLFLCIEGHDQGQMA